MVNEKEVLNCKGWKAINDINPLVSILNVFFQNSIELQELLEKIHNNLQISKEVRKESFQHLQQRIFNYLSSSSALTDAARRIMKHYKGTPLSKEYNNKTTELFKNNELSHFIRSLRNYQTHYELTFPYQVSSLNDKEHWDVILISEELLEHKEQWDSQAIQFINNCGKEVNLTEIFAQYTNLINAFYMWLYAKFLEYHQNDFNERDKLIKESNMNLPPSELNPLNLSSDQFEAVLAELKNDQSHEML